MQKFAGLLRAGTPWWGVILALVAVPILVSVLAIPMRVPVDGVLYISSARSFFTDGFANTYAWFREPGYPAFLAVVHLFGDSSILLIIAQAFCLGAAALIGLYCATRALNRARPSRGLVLLIAALILNPMYLIFSALVLQQAQFALQLALVALFLSLAIRPAARMPGWLLAVVAVLNYALSTWTSVGWIYLGLVPTAVVVAVVAGRWIRAKAPPLHLWLAVPSLAVLSGIVLAGVYALGLSVYGVWTSIRDTYSSAAAGIPTSVIAPTAIPSFPTVQLEIQRLLALMHIGTVRDYVYENNLFLQDQLIRGWPHAEFDTALKAPPYSEFALGYFSLADPVPWLFRPYSVIARIASPVYALVWVGGVLSLVVAAMRSKWELLVFMLVPFYFIGVYALSNSPIDRYGIPAYPLVAVSLAVVLATGANRLAIRLHHYRSEVGK